MTDIKGQILEILFTLPAVALGFTVHEFSHAFCAVRFGDQTPKLMGRFTLNPIKHLDLIGLMMVIAFGYGWAKPVQYNPANLKKPIEQSVLIALAGPVSNLLLALAFLFPFKYSLAAGIPYLTPILFKLVFFNLMLFVFNLVPLPPLDGSHLVFWAIPERYQAARAAFLKYGYWVLTGIILLQAFLNVEILPIGTMIRSLYLLLCRLAGIPLPA
jgi:Zn-dependent protease